MTSKTAFTWSLTILATAAAADGRPLERVPRDGTLEQAIRRVSDRGVIEIAASVYPAPAGGFEIDSPGKSFTVRAAAGATVVLDGRGTGPILVYEGAGAGSGRRVSFERLVFRNGRSDSTRRGGAVTVAGGDAVFVSSTFEDNANLDGQSRGGGAVQIRDGSFVRFTNCDFSGNSARLRGGALYVSDSKVGVVWSRFSDNRTTLPGHHPTSAGGAIFVLDLEAAPTSEVDIRSSRFEGNTAGFAGGAINGFGAWQETLSRPAARIAIANSTFVDNRVEADPCCPPPDVAVGGAAHVEDHVTLEIESSRFADNAADWGGALSSYRAVLEVDDSVFRGNRAGLDAARIAVGGAIALTSSDGGPDPVNRRNAELRMTRSLVQGPGGPGAIQLGGCLFANGDLTRMDGLNGVPQMGTAEDNRARIELRDVVFDDCDVETSANGRASGGAIFLVLADLVMDGSLVNGSDARGENASGGGLAAFDRNAIRLTGNTFARNAAEERGGGLVVNGGSVLIRDGFFLANDVTPSTVPGGPGEQIHQSTGAAISLSPSLGRNRNIAGVVEDSLFVGNVGIPIEDLDKVEGPFNLVRYDGNEFRSTAFGADVFKNNIAGVALGGLTVAELNRLVIQRTGGEPPTDKSARDNRFLGSDPRTGRLVAAPSRALSGGAAGDPAPPKASLGYAWSGGSATLAGVGLGERSGVREAADPGTYVLRVDGQEATRAAIGEGGCSGGRLLCLNRERFLIEVDWRDFAGGFGNAFAAPVAADDSGLYYFFGAENWEILVKVLDGCGTNSHFWLFSAATTNVEYTLRVTDTVSGLTRSYFNPLGAAAAAVTDTTALAACGAASPVAAPQQRADAASLLAELRALVEDPIFGDPRTDGPRTGERLKQGSCAPGPANLCLNGGRFRIEVDWRDFEGNTGAGEVVPFGTADSGLFFFFDRDNWEMLVKVLDGCGTNGRYWVFAAATTNVGYTLRATDTERGAVVEYSNPLGNAAAAITDTSAFETCP